MNFQGLGIWLAILFVANTRESCGQDMSASIGYPQPGDSIYTQHIHIERKPFRIVSHTTGFSVGDRTINAVKFKDKWETGAKIEVIGSPPFSKLEVKFTSMIDKGYYFIMEVHYSDETDVSFNVIIIFWLCFCSLMYRLVVDNYYDY